MGSTRKTFSPKQRLEAIKLVLEENYTVENAAKKKGVGKSTLNKWVRNFKKNGHKLNMNENEESSTAPNEAGSMTSPKISELQSYKNEIKRLKEEKEILKKTISILMSE